MMLLVFNDNTWKSKKTSHYGKSSADRRFRLDSVESIAPDSSHAGDQTSQRELIVFGHFVMKLRARRSPKCENRNFNPALRIKSVSLLLEM